MNKIKTKYYKIDKLVSAEYNPRELTKSQYDQLKDSIKRFGLVDPAIVNINKNRKNIIIGGHQRIKIAKDLGISDIPCIELDLNYEKEKELNIRLNKNVGRWDYETLANNFEVDDLKLWGFDESELDLFIEPDFAELSEEKKEKPPKIQITFKSFEDQEKAIKEIDKLLKNYEGSYYSVSGGEI
tara:strand:+ start:209 stop:760 length:552 start_codon:yes stop_codon:yes gene_type:complete